MMRLKTFLEKMHKTRSDVSERLSKAEIVKCVRCENVSKRLVSDEDIEACL